MKKLLLMFWFAVPLGAQESGAGKDMTAWMWANFLILVVGLGYLCRKYGAPYLAARSEGIRKGIADAQLMKAEADRREAEINAKLANLHVGISAMKEELQKEQARETERLLARNKADFARIQEQVAQEIERSAKAARIELQQHAGRLALDLAEQKIRSRMNPEIQQKLTSEFVRSLP